VLVAVGDGAALGCPDRAGDEAGVDGGGVALVDAVGASAATAALAGRVPQAPRTAIHASPAAPTRATTTRSLPKRDGVAAVDRRSRRLRNDSGNIKTPVVPLRPDVEAPVSSETPWRGAEVAGSAGHLVATASAARVYARTDGAERIFERDWADIDGLTHISVPRVATNQ